MEASQARLRNDLTSLPPAGRNWRAEQSSPRAQGSRVRGPRLRFLLEALVEQQARRSADARVLQDRAGLHDRALQPEVGELDPSTLVHEDVRRVDVPVDEPRRLAVRECARRCAC